jgi:hypothetical protein
MLLSLIIKEIYYAMHEILSSKVSYFRTKVLSYNVVCTVVLSYESTRTSALPYKHLRRYLVLSYSIIYDSTFVLSKVMM